MARERVARRVSMRVGRSGSWVRDEEYVVRKRRRERRVCQRRGQWYGKRERVVTR